jgi:hypothetical protein
MSGRRSEACGDGDNYSGKKLRVKEKYPTIAVHLGRLKESVIMCSKNNPRQVVRGRRRSEGRSAAVREMRYGVSLEHMLGNERTVRGSEAQPLQGRSAVSLCHSRRCFPQSTPSESPCQTLEMPSLKGGWVMSSTRGSQHASQSASQ